MVASRLNFNPTSDFCLIRLVGANKTKGGLHLPEGAEAPEPEQGIVEEVGRGHYTESGQLIAPEVKPGDTVWLLFGEPNPLPVCFSGQKYYVCRARDLIAKVEG